MTLYSGVSTVNFENVNADWVTASQWDFPVIFPINYKPKWGKRSRNTGEIQRLGEEEESRMMERN